jgi:hypothetical protein
LQYAFEEMDREHVISLIDPENVNSIRVAERLGETLEGEVEVGGHRLLVYGISRSAAVPAAGPGASSLRAGGGDAAGPAGGTPAFRGDES